METPDSFGKYFPKMRRGRPSMLSAEQEQMFRQFVGIPDDATHRTVQNGFYWGRALGVLGGASPSDEDQKRWGWLLRTNGHCRKSIVSQLGRVRCEIALRIFADRLCELRPKAQEAVQMVRRWNERRDNMLACQIVEGKVSEDEIPNMLEQVARQAVQDARRACR